MKTMPKMIRRLTGLLLVLTTMNYALAQGDADVVKAVASQSASGSWRFSVTLKHADTGWEDYADGWDVVLPDGSVIKPNAGEAFTRTLWHPHVNEQPFTRSQGNIEIPQSVEEVTVRAHDLRDGFGGKTQVVKLPR